MHTLSSRNRSPVLFALACLVALSAVTFTRADSTCEWSSLDGSLSAAGPWADVPNRLLQTPEFGLVAVGRFKSVSGVPAMSAARWDGSVWHPLGEGLTTTSGSEGVVVSIAPWTWNGVNTFVVGGSFQKSGAVALPYLAVWDGTAWQPFPQSLPAAPPCLARLINDRGEALYASGDFNSDGYHEVRRFDGFAWQAVPAPSGVVWYAIYGLRTIDMGDMGDGPHVYMAGWGKIGGGPTSAILARTDGISAEVVATGLDGTVRDVARFDGPQGPSLVVAGSFESFGGASAPGLARSIGGRWEGLGAGLVGKYATTLHTTMLNGTSVLLIGGTFVRANGLPAQNLAIWDGQSLQPLVPGVVGEVKTLATAPDGGLLVGGAIGRAGDVATPGIARLHAGAWSSLGTGVDQSRDMTLITGLDEAVVDGITRLVVGGQFELAGAVASRGVALCTIVGPSAQWESLDGGFDSGVARVAASFNDGTGDALYVGGDFSRSLGEGASASAIARFRDGAWTALNAPSLAFGPGGIREVRSLVVHDDGSGFGPQLFVGGEFLVTGDSTIKNVAAYAGSGWRKLGTGVPGAVAALAVFDDGGGDQLYAGGTTSSGFGGWVRRWNGTSWLTMTSGSLSNVRGFAVQDDGQGARLYMLTQAGVFRLESGAWVPIVGGQPPVWTTDVCSVESPQGPRLVVVGEAVVSGAGSSAVATEWDGVDWTILPPSLGPLTGSPYSPIANCVATLGATGSMFVMGGSIPSTCDPLMRGLALRVLAVASDLDVDGDVDSEDLAQLLGHWAVTGPSVVGDLDRDGAVGSADLAILLGEWTP